MTFAGLVLDIGHKEATIVPVYEGVPILAAWQALPLAGEAIQNAVKADLIARGVVTSSLTAVDPKKVGDRPELLTDQLLGEITLTCCFVTNTNRGRDLQQLQDSSSSQTPTTRLSHLAPLVNYPISGSEFLQVSNCSFKLVVTRCFRLTASPGRAARSSSGSWTMTVSPWAASSWMLSWPVLSTAGGNWPTVLSLSVAPLCCPASKPDSTKR